MVDPNWGLMQGNNALQYFQYGQQIGAQARESQDRRTMNNALATYITNPKDEAAFQTIAQLDPRTAMQLQQQRTAADKEARRAKIIPLAAKGDQNAMLELWGMDPDMAMKLDDVSKKKVLDSINYISEAAFQIDTLPPEQRPAAWDSYIDQGVSMFPGLAQYKGKYSPEAVNSIIAQAGKMQEFQKFNAPIIKDIQQGAGLYSMDRTGGNLKTLVEPNYTGQPTGTPVGSPTTPQNLPRVATPQDAAKLPPGTQFLLPDGRIGTVPGGPTPKASGGFRPLGDARTAVKQVFPNARITDWRRPANSSLGRANPDSFHVLTGAAVDMEPIPGMTFQQAIERFARAGYTVHRDSRDEVNNPSGHATGPHWHFVLGGR